MDRGWPAWLVQGAHDRRTVGRASPDGWNGPRKKDRRTVRLVPGRDPGAYHPKSDGTGYGPVRPSRQKVPYSASIKAVRSASAMR